MKRKINEKEFVEVCKNSLTMAQASAELGLHFNTFKRYALLLGCYNTNPSGKGMKKKFETKIPLKDILAGKHPQFQTYKLKLRLIKEGLVENVCSVCNTSEWMGCKLNMELDHIDGDRTNHCFENLRMLCPNCHSQTETYRSKNRKN